MTFPPQVTRVESQIADAVARGARVIAGGERRKDLGGGTFFRPTILVDVTPSMDVSREETFGPVLPIIRVRDAEEALRVANASPLGLSGSKGEAAKAAMGVAGYAMLAAMNKGVSLPQATRGMASRFSRARPRSAAPRFLRLWAAKPAPTSRTIERPI